MNNVEKGRAGEDYVCGLLEKHDIGYTRQSYLASVDIVLHNKKTIDVKTATHSLFPLSARRNGPYYCFHIRKDKKGEYANYYLCVIVPTGDVFVIPAIEIPENTDQIRICYPPLKKSTTKYNKFLNAFWLLK